ncbi:MAG: PmoA family protein [Isosphaeraceae bacterium]
MRGTFVLVALLGLSTTLARADDDAPIVGFQAEPASGRLRITVNGEPMATYVYRDAEIGRPHFLDVRAPGGLRITRTHPPGPGDPSDHPTMHPGLWLAFGDLSGSDFWRNKGVVEHERFEEAPQGGAGLGSFAVANRYVSADGKTLVAREVARFTVHVQKNRYLISWRSEFQPGDGPLTFGDQEEMGLGVRLATPLAPKQGQGGRIVNAEGKVGEKEVRGQISAWCAGRGVIDGQPVSVTILTDPDNVRPSWWHARDYGLIVANPFGRAALTGEEPSRVTVNPGERFSLGFGVSIERAEPGATIDPAAGFREYLRTLGRD